MSHQLDYSGAPNALLATARVMRQMGLEVHLLPLADGPLEQEFRSIGVHRIFGTSFEGYDWILLNTAVSARIAHAVPKTAKYILWIHESPLLFVHSDLPFIVAQAARRASGLIFPSESTAVDWARYGDLRSEKKRILYLLSPITFPDSFKPSANSDSSGNQSKMLRLVTVDPVEYFRGHRVIAQAINSLQSIGHDVHFTAVGATEAQTRAVFPMLSVDRLVATERVPRVAALSFLAQSHIYLSASAFATQNLGLCEASMLGIPSVVSDIPVHRAWAEKVPGSVFPYPLFEDTLLSEQINLVWSAYPEHSRLAKLRVQTASELLSERRFASTLSSFLHLGYKH